MEKFKINVYDANGNIIKTAEAVPVSFKFGAIRSLMELLNVESIEDTSELLRTIYKAWDQLTKILSQCFPDMSESEWDNTDLKELVPVVFGILKYSFSEILTIPNDSKN